MDFGHKKWMYSGHKKWMHPSPSLRFKYRIEVNKKRAEWNKMTRWQMYSDIQTLKGLKQ